MKCCFCGGEIKIVHVFLCVCNNDKCQAHGVGYPKFVAQALIDGKDAQDRLKEIFDYLDVMMRSDPRMIWWQGVVKDTYEKVKLASITKQEKE